jgi:hypothetical protein
MHYTKLAARDLFSFLSNCCFDLKNAASAAIVGEARREMALCRVMTGISKLV